MTHKTNLAFNIENALNAEVSGSTFISAEWIARCARKLYDWHAVGGVNVSYPKSRLSAAFKECVFKGLNGFKIEVADDDLKNGVVSLRVDGYLYREEGGVSIVLIRTVGLDEYLDHVRAFPLAWLFHASSVFHFIPDARSVILIGIARESGRVRVFEVDKNASIIKKVSEKIASLNEAVFNEIRPPCECGKCS